MKRLVLAVFASSICAAITVMPVGGYVLLRHWPTPQTTMNFAMGASWDDAFTAATNLWNTNTVFKFTNVRQAGDPCSDPNVAAPINGVKFSADDCGTPWGQGTLATTASWSRNGVVTQAGISFNSTFTWNVYDGPYATGVWAGVQDFRRVALHELGHVIGLGHEDSAPSIMSTFVSQGSTIIQPQADDITGVNILYGAPITDSTGPAVFITSHSNGQTVSTTTITLAGTATDSGRGDGGIASVSINGVRANADTAAGQGTANWREVLTSPPGSNTITVVATDDSQVHNTTTTSITINVAVITSVTSSSYHVFPQFADGKLPDGTFYRTTLMIENSTNSATNCTFQFFSRSSSASNFTVPLTVGPGGWLISPSAGTADFQAGHATLQCSANVEAQLLYSFYSNTGVKLSEATVFSSPSSGAIKIIVDQRQGSQLGLAIANDTDRVITYTIALSDGATSGVLTLFPKSSVAKFLNELLPGVPGDFQDRWSSIRATEAPAPSACATAARTSLLSRRHSQAHPAQPRALITSFRSSRMEGSATAVSIERLGRTPIPAFHRQPLAPRACV